MTFVAMAFPFLMLVLLLRRAGIRGSAGDATPNRDDTKYGEDSKEDFPELKAHHAEFPLVLALSTTGICPSIVDEVLIGSCRSTFSAPRPCKPFRPRRRRC